jgi:transmembrane sensor
MSTERLASTSIPPEIRAEAAAWVARVHGSGRKRSMEGALNSWLAANPLHARAFEVATDAWELGGAVPAAALPRINPIRRPTPRIGLLRALVAGAAIALVALVASLYLGAPSLSTGTGEQRSVTLEDGTRVTLNTDTRLVVHYTEQQRQVRLEQGEAFFDVVKNPRRPFVVSAGGESVVALGTSFMVRRDNDEVEVTLVEGKVSVAPVPVADSAAVPTAEVLTPGQRLRVARSALTVDRPSIDTVTAWRRGEVVLDHTRLADAVEEMNRYSKVKIIVSAPESGAFEVSGIFRTGDSARFARAVAETYRLDIVEEPRRIVLSSPPRGRTAAEP